MYLHISEDTIRLRTKYFMALLQKSEHLGIKLETYRAWHNDDINIDYLRTSLDKFQE